MKDEGNQAPSSFIRHPSSFPWRRLLLIADQIVLPIVVFALVYVTTLLLLAPRSPGRFHWAALASVIVATTAGLLWERGRWNLGLRTTPATAARESILGIAFAVVLIGIADLLVLATTSMRHGFEGRFPVAETFAVFLPAVLHEELLFRGYVFQRLWRWRPWLAIIAISIVFAALHGANASVTPVGLLNVFLGGIVLSLAYTLYERLWFPIGLHLGWNLMSGPFLGYEVSGYPPAASILDTAGRGHPLLTGGAFGIEGSVWMTLVELGAVAVLLRWRWNSRFTNQH
jgi:membrane protease YdiL (CAAX protease family)